MLPVVAVVGRPNVGKSTIFNRIVGDRVSIVDDQSGVTRDRIYSKASWLSKSFNIIDTGGIQLGGDAPFSTEIKAQAEIAIAEADVIVFVVDVNTTLLDDDFMVAKMLFKSKKPIILAVNKVDDNKALGNIYDFYSLGIGDLIPVSGIHGVGIGDLLDKICEYLPEEKEDEYDEDDIKICLIGRPNVGKSSLTNALIGEDRQIVSSVEGTTTDSIDSRFERDGKKYVVIDTAGMKKKGKVYESIDKYSYLRALKAIERSDICLCLIDAVQGIREQDKHVAGYAIESGKALILVVNKWDAIEKDEYTMNEFEKDIRTEFKFLSYVPVVYLSALTKKRVNTLFPVIDEVFENYSRRVQTSVLNDIIADSVMITPPKEHNGVKLKVYYATQVANKCPAFVLFVNDVNALHFSYERYLENRIREAFPLKGTPIKIILRKRD